jgi:hypothetical protein
MSPPDPSTLMAHPFIPSALALHPLGLPRVLVASCNTTYSTYYKSNPSVCYDSELSLAPLGRAKSASSSCWHRRWAPDELEVSSITLQDRKPTTE